MSSSSSGHQCFSVSVSYHRPEHASSFFNPVCCIESWSPDDRKHFDIIPPHFCRCLFTGGSEASPNCPQQFLLCEALCESWSRSVVSNIKLNMTWIKHWTSGLVLSGFISVAEFSSLLLCSLSLAAANCFSLGAETDEESLAPPHQYFSLFYFLFYCFRPQRRLVSQQLGPPLWSRLSNRLVIPEVIMKSSSCSTFIS